MYYIKTVGEKARAKAEASYLKNHLIPFHFSIESIPLVLSPLLLLCSGNFSLSCIMAGSTEEMTKLDCFRPVVLLNINPIMDRDEQVDLIKKLMYRFLTGPAPTNTNQPNVLIEYSDQDQEHHLRITNIKFLYHFLRAYCNTSGAVHGNRITNLQFVIKDTKELSLIAGLFNVRSIMGSPTDGDQITQGNASSSSCITPSSSESVGNLKRKSTSRISCSCHNKISCLLLSCECFAAAELCTENCSCVNCVNKPQKIQKILEKLPEKTKKPKEGCACQSTRCLEGRCSCLKAMKLCTENCRCSDCGNLFDLNKLPE